MARTAAGTAWLSAVLIVLLAAIGGVLITGDPTVGPYALLRQPEWAPTLTGWMTVAAVYYVAVLFIVARLLQRMNEPGATLALSLVLLVLIGNEIWNVTLFQFGRPDLAFYALFPFGGLVLAAAVAAGRVDLVSSMIMAAYLGWVGFDMVWTRELMELNGPPGQPLSARGVAPP
ncbi:MAG: tryptophan-rich sensory protein [Pseudomonadota bacterium]